MQKPILQMLKRYLDLKETFESQYKSISSETTEKCLKEESRVVQSTKSAFTKKRDIKAIEKSVV